MKKLRKMTAMAFAVLLVLSGIPGAFSEGWHVFAAESFTDVKPQYWGAAYIEFAAEKGIINGYPQSDGTYIFAPENLVSMEEAAAMLYRSLAAAGQLKSEEDFSEPYRQLFDDNRISEWARPYIAYGLEFGIILQEEISVFTDDMGRGMSASRLRAALWSAKALETSGIGTNIGLYGLPYTDADSLSEEAWPHIDLLYRQGIMQGSLQTDGSLAFMPDSNIKRSEFAAISNRVYDAAEAKSNGGYDLAKDTASHRGTVSKLDSANRKVLLSTETGTTISIYIDPKSQIVYNGKVMYNGLESISAGQIAIIAAMASASAPTQAQFWSGPVAGSGTVLEINALTGEISEVVIADDAKNPVRYLKTESTKSNKEAAVGKDIQFIADGVKLIEII